LGVNYGGVGGVVEGAGLKSELFFADFFGNGPVTDSPLDEGTVLVDAAEYLIRCFPEDVFEDGLGVLEDNNFL
jgi:hypothetical protein